MDPREAEITAASQNPSIISSLSGAPSPSITPPASPPPEMAQAQGVAQDLSSELYGSGFVGGGGAQGEAAMQELFKADQQLEQTYQGASPFSAYPGYVANPATQTSALSGFAGQMGNVAQQSIGAVDTAERSYQTAVNATMDKFLDFLQMQEDRKRQQEDRAFEKEKFEYQKEQDRLTRSRAGSGAGADEALKQTIISELQSGVSMQDVIRRHPEVDPTEIANYNKSVHGEFRESEEQLRALGIDPSGVRGAVGTAEAQPSLENEGKAIKMVDNLLKGNYQAVSGTVKTPKFLGSIVPGAAAARTDYEGLESLLSLAKRGELKGSGQVSDFETRMLTKAALAGLDMSLPEEEFRVRLQQLKDDLLSGGAVSPDAGNDEWERIE